MTRSDAANAEKEREKREPAASPARDQGWGSEPARPKQEETEKRPNRKLQGGGTGPLFNSGKGQTGGNRLERNRDKNLG